MSDEQGKPDTSGPWRITVTRDGVDRTAIIGDRAIASSTVAGAVAAGQRVTCEPLGPGQLRQAICYQCERATSYMLRPGDVLRREFFSECDACGIKAGMFTDVGPVPVDGVNS
jgi:hypothetical protein